MLLRFVEWLESGEKSPQELLSLCRRRIAEQDGEVRAWVEVAPQGGSTDGPLRGIPFGAKDIFETRGLATEYGSPLYAGRKGERDAGVIQELQRAGAVLLGKTHTTAFAFFDPAPTRNPRLAGHTPGGSSAGSAAAVAAGMVPFALGTQTLGSVLRPASYCGICGFKPSHGRIGMEGVLPFAPSLDTAGFFTETAADMACLWSRGFGGRGAGELRRGARFRTAAGEVMESAVNAAVERLRGGGMAIDDLDIPPGWDRLTAAARLIHDYEGARTHAARYREFGERVGARLAELVRTGLHISEAEYAAAGAHVARMRNEIARVFREYDVIFTPAATGAAPAGYDSTGDPAANAAWSALGLPAISVPLPGPVPLGLQMTAAHGADDALAEIAAQAEALAPAATM